VRLTPAQIDMLALCGKRIPFCMPDTWTLADIIRSGRDSLVETTGVDFEYDATAWHEHLQETNAGGYRWSNKHLGMPGRIAKAINNPEWNAAVAELRARGPAD
jgi:hypothetical protein